jgi:hypothetical protein
VKKRDFHACQKLLSAFRPSPLPTLEPLGKNRVPNHGTEIALAHPDNQGTFRLIAAIGIAGIATFMHLPRSIGVYDFAKFLRFKLIFTKLPPRL